MNIKKSIILLVSIFFSLIPIAHAGVVFSLFSNVFKTRTISYFYGTYTSWIEFAIYSVIFIALVLGVFNERFGKKQTKVIAITMGLSLALALANFYPGLIGNLGPIAFLIFIAIFWYLIFASLKKGWESKVLCMAVAYVISFIILLILDPMGKMESFFGRVKALEWMWSALQDLFVILFFVACVAILTAIFWLFMRLLWDKRPGGQQQAAASAAQSTPGKKHTWLRDLLTGGRSTQPETPGGIAKKLRGYLKDNRIFVDKLESALELYNQYEQAKDELSEEERKEIIAKITAFINSAEEIDHTKEVGELLNQSLVEIEQLKRIVDPDNRNINGIPLRHYIQALFNRGVPDADKKEINEAIVTMAKRSNELREYGQRLMAVKRQHDAQRVVYKNLWQQTIAKIGTGGDLSNLGHILTQLLNMKLQLSQYEDVARRTIEDFAYILADIKNSYGNLENVEKGQEMMHLNSIVQDAETNIQVRDFKNLINKFINTFEGERTFENFMNWVKHNTPLDNDAKIFANFRLIAQNMQGIFEAHLNQAVRTYSTETGYTPEQTEVGENVVREVAGDPRELFLRALEYARGKPREEISLQGFLDYLISQNEGDNLPEILHKYHIDETKLRNIMERATGTFFNSGITHSEYREQIHVLRSWFYEIPKRRGGIRQRDLTDAENHLKEADELLDKNKIDEAKTEIQATKRIADEIFQKLKNG